MTTILAGEDENVATNVENSQDDAETLTQAKIKSSVDSEKSVGLEDGPAKNKSDELVEGVDLTNNMNKASKSDESSGNTGGFIRATQSQALRPFVIISTSYLLFTITDGAIRMIVLQHAYNKSFSAMQVAIMFTLYELAGVFTNLVRSKVQRTYSKHQVITGDSS